MDPPGRPASRTQLSPPKPHGQSTTSLRPRNKRLISGLEELDPDYRPNHTQNASTLSTPFESPFQSRAPSPIPSMHPSRSSSTNPAYREALSTSPGRLGDRLSPNSANDLAASLSGLWGKSWTSLQGLASNVLGSDAQGEMIKDKSPQRQKRPREATHSRNGQAKGTWGPQLRDQSQPGAGSKEERRALVRQQKRQDLLMGSNTLLPDAARYKRRTSDDIESISAPPGEHDDRDALVYIHHVTPDDTLPGLAIKFNSQLAVLKKSNRMWSNDAIQSRKTLVIPVDACGVKGRPVANEEGLLGNDGRGDRETTPRPPQSTFPDPARNNPTATLRRASAAQGRAPGASPLMSPQALSPTSNRSLEEPPWKHDSWVHLDGHPHPVEIARLPRRDLGFFPRARRRSVSFSDLDSPSASFDLPRPSMAVSDTASSRDPSHRKRGSSGSNKWAHQIMSGPGGVGTLGGKGASAPGPSIDKFTQAMSKHLPSVAPPQRSPDDYEDEAYPNSGGLGLEHIGGAIEGWARKMAKSVAKAVEQNQQLAGPGQSRRKLGLGQTTSSGGGDLIELSNAFEIGEEDVDDDDREEWRGRARVSESRSRSHHSGAPNKAETDDGPKRKGD